MAKKTTAKAPKIKPAKKAPRTSALAPRPESSPTKSQVARKDKKGPENDLRRAENILARGIETYNQQAEHNDDTGLNLVPFWERLKAFEDIHHEKGLLKSKRDLTYDWAGFCDEVCQVEEDLLEAVLENRKDKVNRMIWTASITEEEAKELWAEADEKNHVRGKIWGFSGLIRKLRARGCTDPGE